MAIPVAAIGVNPMHAEDLEALRRHMLAEISAATVHVSDLIGKTALDERVMMAMGKVPRHEFVPIEFQPYAYANIPLPIVRSLDQCPGAFFARSGR